MKLNFSQLNAMAYADYLRNFSADRKAEFAKRHSGIGGLTLPTRRPAEVNYPSKGRGHLGGMDATVPEFEEVRNKPRPYDKPDDDRVYRRPGRYERPLPDDDRVYRRPKYDTDDVMLKRHK